MLDMRELQIEEDHLPFGQAPIQTMPLKHFSTFVHLLLESKASTGYSTMGIVTGRAGVGKSIAIQAFLQDQVSQPHTGLPACIEIRVKPSSTPKALVEDLLTRLGERAIRLHHTRYNLADEAARAILSNDVQLIFVDEADHLKEDGFEFLRYIFGKTGCPLIIVGLRTILPTVNRHEKFASRIGLRLNFLSPSDKEILSTVLPGLLFARWRYDPENEEDRDMGQQLWDRVKPSFRDLRTVLQIASKVAEWQDAPRITPFILKKAYSLVGRTQKMERLREKETENYELTRYEKESQQRQDARRKHKERL